MRFFLSIYLLCGASAQLAFAVENLWFDVARSSITNHELHRHVSVLADDMLEGREAGSRGGRAAARYITKRLEEAALLPAGPGKSFSQTFQGKYRNLLALLQGTDPELQDECLIVGAHYDHVGYGTRRNSYGPWGYIHNGADDNASGVATLLEVIDALTRTEHRPKRSILFAFWDGEEKGLLGSKYWINHPTIPLRSVRLAVNIDMVGRLENGRIEVMGVRTGVGLRRKMSATQLSKGIWLDFPWKFKDNSDHWTFYEARVPSLCIHTGVHDDYHRPSDDVEKINFEGMCEVSRYLLEQLDELADADQLPDFRSQVRLETPETQRHVEKPLPAMASRLGFTWKYHPGKSGHLLVGQVVRNATAQAGLLAGDRIVAVHGQPITSELQLPAIALASEAKITVGIQRAGTDMPLTLEIPLTGSRVRLGLSWRNDLSEPGTVQVTRVVPFSPAAVAGLKVHDRIYALSGKSFLGQEDLFTQVKNLLADDAPEIRFEVESRGIVRDCIVSLQPPGAAVSDPTL